MTPGTLLKTPAFRLSAVPAAWWRRLFALLLAGAVLVAGVRYYAKAEKPSRLGDQTRTAFLRWRPQIQSLDTGTDIYRAFHYPNPPVMALILYPLTELPPLTGAMAWFYLKAAMAAATAVWAFRLLEGDKEKASRVVSSSRLPDWAKALAVAFSLHPVLGDLSHGNVNIFLAFLVVGALECYRRRLDVAAGLVLALAIACKVTPALFVPYFAWKRGWRVLAGVAAGLALWLAAVPGAVLGWEYNATLLTSWFDGMVRPFVIDGKVTTEHPNQSIPGVVFRLLTQEPSFLEYDEGDGHPVAAGFNNLTDIGVANARLVVKGLMLAFAAALVWLCRYPAWRADVQRAGPFLAAECGLILLGMLLFSERTWKHHATTLIVPFAVLAWAAATPTLPRAVRGSVGGAFAAVFGLTVVPSLLGGEAQDLALVYGTYTAAFVLEAAALCVVLAAIRRGSIERSRFHLIH